MMGNYPASLAWADRSLELNDRYIQAVGFKAASLAQLGRAEEARVAIEEFLEHFPGMTAARYRTRFNFKNQSDVHHYMEGLIKAGMPARTATRGDDSRPASSVDRSSSIRQSQRRSRTGVFYRWDHRGRDYRIVRVSVTTRHRPDVVFSLPSH